VGAATIDKGDIRVMLNELGTVTPLATVIVKTQLNGPLVEVGFQEGQLVQKGDFLAQIDPRPYQVALEQAQGQLAHDQGLLLQAQTDLKRYQTLGKQDSIAQQQVDDQKFLVAQYTGTVQTDQGAVDSAKLNLTYAHIIAPVTGQVGLRQVDAGNYVQTSDANGIVVLTQLQPISVIFSVPEDNLPPIIRERAAGHTLVAEAYDRANATLLATGELTTLDNQIDTTTGTLKLRATFANPDELLIPNQFVNIRLLVSTMKDSVRVPVPAVQRGEPGTFVYLINADNTVSVRVIKVGPVDGAFQAVLSGLQPGDRVVTDGTDRLRDGAAVVVPAASGNGQRGGQRRGQGAAGQGASQAGSQAANQAGSQAATPAGSQAVAPAGSQDASPAGSQAESQSGSGEGRTRRNRPSQPQ
jgi:multidrug efflux system membrane fusion protein